MDRTFSLVVVLVALFITHGIGYGQTLQYVQDFDGVSIPELPPGWSSPESVWATSASVPSPGSGGNNVEVKGGDTGSLVSPVFDFTSLTVAELRYIVRRTATYDSLNLNVEASLDGGKNWTVMLLDSTASIPAPPSAYVTVNVAIPAVLIGASSVRFRFSALNPTGGNLRIDDIELLADGPVSWNRIGFSENSSTAIENTDSLVIPIGIYLIPSSDSLQGLQFTLGLSSGLTFVSFEPGEADLNLPGWHVSHESRDSTVSVVVLAEGGFGLPPISTDSLLLLTVRTPPLGGAPGGAEVVDMHSVIASAVSATGDDLFLAVEPASHQVTVVPRAPELSIDSVRVDVGTVREDTSKVVSILLTNSGTGVLQVLDMFSISGLLGIDPAFLSLAPDSSAHVALTVDGATYGVGPLEDWLVIEHDAATSPDTVAIVGTVISADTRGDANGDGYVDVVDLVLGIDLVLGRVELPDTGIRLDLHPFPGGNGSVDVRDLTVLAQAIAKGIWPDGASLPVTATAVAKSGSVVGDLIMRETLAGLELWVRSAEPLRALHLVGRITGTHSPVTPNADLPFVHMGSPYGTLGADSFSLLAFGIKETLVSQGTPLLLITINGIAAEDIEVVSSVAVDGTIGRRSFVVVRETTEVPDEAAEIVFDPPYPNPVDPGRTALLHLPFKTGSGHSFKFVVTDVIGRTVRSWDYAADPGYRIGVWNMRNSTGLVVPAGLYFVTVRAENQSFTRSVVVQ